MRARDVFMSLAGSAVVYAAMAACSSGGGGAPGSRASGAGAGGTTHGSGGNGAIAAASASGTGASSASATGASGASGTSASGASGSGAGGTGATGAAGAGGSDSGLIDVLINPVPSASADPTSGQRLKAIYRQGDDGAKEYVPNLWFDSQRNENCTFVLAGDGHTRCLPDGAATSLFADASCTTPIVMVPSGCAQPPYAIGTDTATCGNGGTHVYKIGAASTPTTVYASASSQCFSAGPAAPGFSFFSVGAEVPAASFVSATTHHD